MAYHGQPNVYYQPPIPPPQYSSGGHKRTISSTEQSSDGLGPAAELENSGNNIMLRTGASMYLDQYGHPHPVHGDPYSAGNDEPAPEGPRIKRPRSEESSTAPEARPDAPAQQEEEEEEQFDDSDDDFYDKRNTEPLPTSMRLATKPTRPRPTTSAANARQKLMSLFATDSEPDLRVVFDLGHQEDAPDFDIDMVIDPQGHTALHWACALAKTRLVMQLIDFGADIHRGNFAGETALVRSVLTTNHAEAGTFDELLQILGPSMRTLDHAYRSIIHHIVLVAALKGRAQSARSYLTSVLEWGAKEQKSTLVLGSAQGQDQGNSAGAGASAGFSLKNLVDVQDSYGDTALNVAARIGNKGLVNLLLDAGADKAKANKLGLKPVDFGLDVHVSRLVVLALTAVGGETQLIHVGSATVFCRNSGGEFEIRGGQAREA